MGKDKTVALRWWNDLSETEKEVLIDMAYRMDEMDFQAYGVVIDEKNGNYIEE